MAVKRGNFEVVQYFIKEAKGDPTVKTIDKQNLLHISCWFGWTGIVLYLLELKVIDINSVDKDGWTPLHGASYQGRNEIVKLLLKHGANPNVANNEKKTPTGLAKENGKKDVLKSLDDINKRYELAT